MATIPQNGGPAFPQPGDAFEDGDKVARSWNSPGMSLRDYFAAKALNGLLSDAQSIASLREHFGANVTEPIVAACYDFADAMLAAREGK